MYVNIIDISWPIAEKTTAYKNRSVIAIQETKQFEVDNVRETVITLGSHSGTHIDAPSHFLRDGATISDISLATVMGTCIVLDLTHCETSITREDLLSYDSLISPGIIVLLRTRNSDLSPYDTFNSHFIALAECGALYCVEKEIKAIGIDYLGIENSQPGHPTHKSLLNANITVIEGLRLKHVESGNYFFIALPLLMVGLEAAPARAVLIVNGVLCEHPKPRAQTVPFDPYSR